MNCWYCLRKIKNSSLAQGLFLLLVVVILLGFILYLLDKIHFDFFNLKDHKAIIELHAAGLIILTTFLVWVAWFQFDHFNKTSKSDFLLRIDQRFGDAKILKARKIIRQIDYENLAAGGISDACHLKKISKKIKAKGRDKSLGDFIYLLNFLDFLETIAYFCNKNRMSDEDIEELIGFSIVYYYEVFKEFMDYRNRRYDREDCYCELKELAKRIKCNMECKPEKNKK